MVYHYNNSAYLINDDGSVWTYIPPVGGISNSQCTINSVSGSDSGNNWTFTVGVTFKPAYAGAAKPIYLETLDHADQNSGEQQVGTWNVQPLPEVSAVSATPASGSGFTQTFAFHYSDTAGAIDISSAWVWFNPTLSFSNGASSKSRPDPWWMFSDRYTLRRKVLGEADTTNRIA